MISSRVDAVIGLSYQDYDQTDVSFDEVNPKFGLRVAVTDALEFRAAYFGVVKPALSSNRTLEPTQVAGFNQFFDDPNGTKSDRYGLGLDGKVSPAFSYGAEITRRKIEGLVSPAGGSPFFEDRDEWLHRAYAYWTPTDNLAVDFSLVYDRFENQANSAVSDSRPSQVNTYSLPVSVRYFRPNGLYAGARATYVDQEVEAETNYRFQTGDSSFTLLDLMVGYRFPNRRGIASLSVQNVFDKEFSYLDDSYRTFQDEPTTGPYIPDRSIMAQLSFNF